MNVDGGSQAGGHQVCRRACFFIYPRDSRRLVALDMDVCRLETILVLVTGQPFLSNLYETIIRLLSSSNIECLCASLAVPQPKSQLLRLVDSFTIRFFNLCSTLVKLSCVYE